MNLDKIIKSAINISDQLDRANESIMADKIDSEIIESLVNLNSWQNKMKKIIAEQNYEEIEMEIPEEERLMLEDVLFSLQESLKGN